MGERSGYVELPKEAVKAKSFDCIKKSNRLFYRELINFSRPTGRWIEIYNVPEFVEIQEQHIKKGIKYNCSHERHINHHDFHVIID